ncbi:MAG: hypothetical protein F6K36_10800 [Symploca sp. SIO3C6]|nr:hypothetical protein [Symploca sp. SIO3C6]
MTITNYNVGLASAYPPYSNSTFLDDNFTEDVYHFSVNNPSSINLNLHNITAGDNADIYLYSDDGDGLFELNEDLQLAISERVVNSDDSINYFIEPGDYFARVVRDEPDSQGRLDYELDLSASMIRPSREQAPNLLPEELEVGTITTSFLPNTFTPNTPETITLSGEVGNFDSADTYHFSAVSPNSSSGGDGVIITASLTGLTSDADIRLIEDRNGNQIVDPGEVIESSTLGSTSNESFSQFIGGQDLLIYDYFVQVYQYSGETSYDLNMSFTAALG